MDLRDRIASVRILDLRIYSVDTYNKTAGSPLLRAVCLLDSTIESCIL